MDRGVINADPSVTEVSRVSGPDYELRGKLHAAERRGEQDCGDLLLPELVMAVIKGKGSSNSTSEGLQR